MSSWASVAGSWGCFAGVVILGWYYYTKDGGQPKRISRRKSNSTIEDVLGEIATPKEQKQSKLRKKAQKAEAVSTTTNGSAVEGKAVATTPSALVSRRGKSTDTAKSAQSSAIDTSSAPSSSMSKESDVDVKEFARQMAKAQTGTTFTGSKNESKRIRTQKQSKMNDSFGPNDSGTSSNAGADADDDLSSVNSAALSTGASPDTTGVADMLEAAGPGPSTLRITEPLVPAKPQQKHVKKEQVVETKKQRQNRLKREREKEANREAEAQRRVLEEKQRRTAREAEGRPAKNGNGWTYDSGLPANAWSTGKTPLKTAPTINGSLLDTREEPAQLPTIIDNVDADLKPKGNGTGGINGSRVEGTTSHWGNDLPSEEEQFRLIQEQSEESEWTTVSQPKRTKRTTSNVESSSSQAPTTKQPSFFPAGFQTDVMD
ncbi:MAG: hypothetical protein GOMPHAMPRED_005656 [Gomphillus americanus]|uniref:Uncharacterized protein n=1 Tax=Gomphillus americanus TaxID=1940652 RepID=A0A8H3FWP4_9LECA|nr:MAG: hypothetical protein GOMPHAMPRED_005656 [Gomphillus americanus]